MPSKPVRFTTKAARRIMNAVRSAEMLRRDATTEKAAVLTRQPPQQLFAVIVTKDGGDAGTLTTSCDFTYTVETEAGTPLGETMTPAKCRLVNVPYVDPGTDPAWGAGFFDKAGDFVLWDANECPDVEDPCPPDVGQLDFVAP